VETHRYALRLLYDGAAFRGFQRQPGLPTVQECLERALSDIGIRGRIEAAARTDAGVHAIDQVVSFSTWADTTPERIRVAVNGAAPPGLLCLDAARVGPRFHARASAVARRYLYLVAIAPPVELGPYAWALPDERAFPGLREPRLDMGAARAALALAVGEHDFRGFARPGEQTRRGTVDPRATVRRLERADITGADWGPLWAIVLEGRGFLRAMARNLVGTAVTVGLGLAPPERVRQLIEGGLRYRGVRAPGWGLTLVEVRYAESPFLGAAVG